MVGGCLASCITIEAVMCFDIYGPQAWVAMAVGHSAVGLFYLFRYKEVNNLVGLVM